MVVSVDKITHLIKAARELVRAGEENECVFVSRGGICERAHVQNSADESSCLEGLVMGAGWGGGTPRDVTRFGQKSIVSLSTPPFQAATAAGKPKTRTHTHALTFLFMLVQIHVR
ncbi:hypothetical protein LSTR_LSTR002018 [Laodelphax striatellus]|uniref:Uncharacterized protein n=1 Tax=Laodelphax striatellus TaxID=195883 RepID=A0A482XHA4_LAOST|nr:hypothetical protein LSTR_LSTR014861 [Laodelphax striatellus]RZF45057.1 hypothetical protein LSTR_LSTR002018 [Laodelphax striatellus]